MNKFNHLNIPTHWQQFWTRYPEGYTILEALINWTSQVNLMVDNVNDWNKYLDDFVENFDKKLEPTIIKTLYDMVNDGTLAQIINEHIFKDLNSKIDRHGIFISEFVGTDDEKINSALEIVENGQTIIIDKDILVTKTVTISNKKNILIKGYNTTITTDRGLLPILLVLDSESVKISDITLDGDTKAIRGVEILRSPHTKIDGVVIRNVGSSSESTSTAGIIIKEMSDHTGIYNTKIISIHASEVASGVWIQNFSENPTNISKHLTVSGCHIEDVSPNADADGVKALGGSFNRGINLIVENSVFIDCRKRALKFQARGCKSNNNTIYLNRESRYCAIDFQYGDGGSTNDTIISDIPSTISGGMIYYMGIKIGASNISVIGLKIFNYSDLNNQTNRNSRAIVIGSHSNQETENIVISDCIITGDYIELRNNVKNLHIYNNNFNCLSSRLIECTSDVVFNSTIIKDNTFNIEGKTSGQLFGGNYQIEQSIIEINYYDGVERYFKPFRKGNYFNIEIGNEFSPMNYQIINGQINTFVNSDPGTNTSSRYLNLFMYADKGDIAYRENTSLTGEDYTTYNFAYVCWKAPTDEEPTGSWRPVNTKI